MEALVSNFNTMDMKTDEILELEIQQKPEPVANQNHKENGVNQEKQTDEILGTDVNLEPVETCEKTITETDVSPEKKADGIQGSEVNSEPVETCQEIVVETDVDPGKQADPKVILGVDLEPIETHKETVLATDVIAGKQTADPGVIYRCRRCRQMVATQEYVVSHEVGQGHRNFGPRKKSDTDEDDKKPECSMCIFVEPMKWMKAVEEGYISHKLYCMGCKALLGQFNWAGMQCNCGIWVIPAFQLTKSKIDECSM